MSESELPFGYPDFPGYSPHGGSLEAAERIAPKRRSLVTKIYAALQEKPSERRAKTPPAFLNKRGTIRMEGEQIAL